MKNITQELYNKYPDVYMRKIVEELNELACAISHFIDGKITQEQLVEEISDVNLQLFKLNMWLTCFDKVLFKELIKEQHDQTIQKLKNLEKFL